MTPDKLIPAPPAPVPTREELVTAMIVSARKGRRKVVARLAKLADELYPTAGDGTDEGPSVGRLGDDE